MDSKFNLNTPVLFLIFNRPDTTKEVFEAIRQAKPPRLYVAADGARSDRLGETEKVKLVRDYVMDHVDWECEIKTLFRENNLGCRVAVSSAIDWFFENEEMGIILEDDCLPHATFFQFCEELLDIYKEDQRIFMISGTNTLINWKSSFQDYHFSYYGGIWGWASWKRAWSYYDPNMMLWPQLEIQEIIRSQIENKKIYEIRRKQLQSTYNGEINTWDFQWFFARLLQSGLSVVPSVNLISNIGFGSDGTHTHKAVKGVVSSLPLFPMTFPLRPPYGVALDREYSLRHNRKMLNLSFWGKVFNRINTIFSKSLLK